MQINHMMLRRSTRVLILRHLRVRDAPDLVRVDSDWDAEGPGQAKVRQFDDSFVVNQEVLWFQVPVEDSATVAEQNALQDLIKVTLKGRDGAHEQRNSVIQPSAWKKPVSRRRDSPSPAWSPCTGLMGWSPGTSSGPWTETQR